MRALVTGGGGFLGGVIAKQLLEAGHAVRVLGRNRYPHMEALGAEGVVCDLSIGEGLAQALEGVDVVFHVAALAGMWGPRARYLAANVTATERLLEAAKAAGVERFVYTSSPSVTFHGTDEKGVSEADCSYPDKHDFFYSETKAIAERLVLAANSATLATTALRPHLIYGPGDPHLIPRLLDRHRAGRLKVLGDGENQVALTYVDNAAVAHLQAAEALAPGSSNAGKAYFITDGDPVSVWGWLNRVFTELGEGKIKGRVPKWLAMPLSGVAEAVWRGFNLDGEPPITRFAVSQISTSHWFDLSAAKQDFGYQPLVTGEEGFQRMVKALKVTQGQLS